MDRERELSLVPLELGGEAGYARLNRCVHCGLCLPVCPTYVETSNEADSPRGRIHLMKAVADGVLEPSAGVLGHLDKCLLCRACEPACPSGVEFHRLMETIRPQVAERVRGRAGVGGVLGWMMRHVLPYPKRLRAAIWPMRAARAVGLGGVAERVAGRVSRPLGAMAAMLPEGALMAGRAGSFTRAVGERRGSVLLLQGCVGSVVSGRVNRAAAGVLAANGFDVYTLGNAERCCGALAAHANDPAGARERGREMVELLSGRGEDYFVSPIAGCGAQLKELAEVVGETDPEGPAHRAAGKVRDILELLDEAGLREPKRAVQCRVTYHDPCHLLNVQKLAGPPRRVLGRIPGVEVVELPETEICCGAAGSYNLSEPEMSGELGGRKARNILGTGAAVCATANVGCQLQMRRALERAGSAVPVVHVVELLAVSYGVMEVEGVEGGETRGAQAGD